MAIALYTTSIVLFIIYTRLIFYYRHGWKSFPEFENKAFHKRPNTKISVIVPARNEEKNIKACIQSILLQDYPEEMFEIIIVDDYSTDNTAIIVNSLLNKNLKLVTLKDFIKGEQLNSYKKKAIEIAIQQSTGKLIVTTDADCIVPNKWLKTISDFYQLYNQPAFIAGPVSYLQKNNFLAIFESLDFMTMQGITAASVKTRFHNMCNGANIAYEKQAFFDVDGFKNIDTIASGDDMLLMNKIYKRYPNKIGYLKSKDAIVQTATTGNISAFFNQRIRWASKADKYDDKRIFRVLFLVYFFNSWLIVLGIFSIFNFQFLLLLLGSLIVKTIIELIFLFPVSKFFNQQKLLWWFPFMQPFHVVYIVVAGWLGKFGTYKWKERKVQ